MQTLSPTRRELPWLAGSAFLAALAACGLALGWADQRAAWAFATWGLLALGGAALRSPRGLYPAVAAVLVFVVAMTAYGWPADGARLTLAVAVTNVAATIVGVAVGQALIRLTGAFRPGMGAPAWRPTARGTLLETATLACLVAVSLAIIFAPARWGGWAWLTGPPLLLLLGALRRPRHGWLVALEVWLAVVIADRAYTAWGPPAATPQPFVEIVVEYLFFIPIAWALVVLGRWLGRRPGDGRLAAPAARRV